MNFILILILIAFLTYTTLCQPAPIAAPSTVMDCSKHGITLLDRDDMITFLAARRVEQKATLVARLASHCEAHSKQVCDAVAAMQENMGEHPKVTSWWLEMGLDVGLCVADVFHHLEFHAAYDANDGKMHINLDGGPRADFAYGCCGERYRETYKSRDGKINDDVIMEYFKILDAPPPPQPSWLCHWCPYWFPGSGYC